MGVRQGHGPASLRDPAGDPGGPGPASTFTVLNLADSGDGSPQVAILAAESNPGADVIDFAPGVEGTITLTSGELLITTDLTINGPGVDRLTVSGNDFSRVFNVMGTAAPSTAIAVSISDLTIADGRDDLGGGVNNQGFSDLTLRRVVLSGNTAVGSPTLSPRGAVRSFGSGASLSVVESQVVANSADGLPNARAALGGGIYVEGGSPAVQDSTVADNRAVGGFGGSVCGGGITRYRPR